MSKLMRVDELGEFQVIARLTEVLRRSSKANQQYESGGQKLLLSIGDDAAAWRTSRGIAIYTTDTMVSGVHFQPRIMSWDDLGWKSLAVNVSDVIAMGGRPTYAVVTLGLPGEILVKDLELLYEGMAKSSNHYRFEIVGGDVVKSPVLFISVALVGHLTSKQMLTRSKAKLGDQIAVTGHLGCSGAGLRLMTEKLPMNKHLTTHFLRAHNRPEPNPGIGALLIASGVQCAMDISDGLISDLEKICEMSAVGAVINIDTVPADDHLKIGFPGDWQKLVCGGGEDYELLFTAPEKVMTSVKNQIGENISVIGEISVATAGINVIDGKGQPIDLSHRGWDHFGPPDG